MKNFILRASTLTNEFLTFTLNDIPLRYDDTHLALIAKPGTPLLDATSIVRGDPETNLFEGDIVSSDNHTYVICYERGFYAIDSDHAVRYLYTLNSPKVIGNYWTDGFPVKVTKSKRQLFKYEDKIFRIMDIIGDYGSHILIRSNTNPIDPNLCKQEACLSYNKTRVFLGDTIEDSVVELTGGRICINKDGKYYDLSTKHYLEDYNGNT